MVLQSPFNASPVSCDLSRRQRSFLLSASPAPIFSSCPCASVTPFRELRRMWKVKDGVKNVGWVLFQAQGCINGGSPGQNFNAASHGRAKNIVLKRFLDEDELVRSSSSRSVDSGAVNYYSADFGDDPIIHKMRNQLGVIHPLPGPPMNQNGFGFVAFFFFVGGVVFDKLWNWTPRKTNSINDRPYVPTSLSLFLEKDLQRKESVEWVNMVLAKLWKVYRSGIENWIIGLLQPVIDNIQKPDYVQRVEIKQFSLGDEPLSVRSVERRTSRRVNDLQYQISLRYTGDARMLLSLSLKFSVLPIVVPVGIRDFDIDGELWVKLRLIAMQPWVGSASWAFVSLPKIKFELSPFRLFNLMAIPVLSMFLTKLLTEDLPKLFVRPKKIVLDFHKGKSVGPIPDDPKSGVVQEGNRNFTGELSVTLLDARKLSYLFYGKTDPYVILRLGKQVIRSKRNSQTTVIGPPGEPIWNQDFHLLAADPRKEKLLIEVRDSVGFMDLTVGTGEVDLASLKDTVPTDRVVSLRGGWDLFGNGSAGEIVLCLTYKAYVEDEEDERLEKISEDAEMSEDEFSDSEEPYTTTTEQPKNQYGAGSREESLVDVLMALLASEEFRGIMTSDTAMSYKSLDGTSSPEPYAPKKLAGKQITTSSSASSQGLALFWLAVTTSISVIIALNMDHSNLFNP